MNWAHIEIILESAVIWAKTRNKAVLIARVKRLARELGYDLVERITPQQAHDFMLARRRAEDGELVTDAAGHVTGPR